MSTDQMRAVAARQHGVISWRQLLTHMPRTTIEGWVASGHLQRVQPEVYRLAGAPDTWRQRVMIAVLDSGGLASHRTAPPRRCTGLTGITARSSR